jgi:hypothetical protein
MGGSRLNIDCSMVNCLVPTILGGNEKQEELCHATGTGDV